MILNAKGNYKKAEKIHKQSLAIREKYNDKHGIAVSLLALGHLKERREEIEKALIYYEKSLDFFQTIKHKKYVKIIKKSILRAKNRNKSHRLEDTINLDIW